ncbi:hypothetical protein R80B4_02900 [Fibrobacteres bacterium R8-0-B4]
MNLGKFQQIDLRDYWGNEATEFTPWLAVAENIALLSDAIGIDIEVEGTEVFIGSFKADILGRDSNNNKIIIENQLERSNHDHLGKIITYASGINASIIIWICSNITEEHRQAIDWLNENTDENINFFAIEIELWKINNSDPAPRFNIICKPNEWVKKTKVATTPIITKTQSLYLEYWTYLNDYFSQEGTCLSLGKPTTKCWHGLSFLKKNEKNLNIRMVIDIGETSKIVCSLWIWGAANAKKIFFKLREEKESIEKEIGPELEWEWDEEPKKKNDASIYIIRDGDFEDRNQWEEITKWLKEYSEKFYKTFSDRVKNLEL